MTGDHQQSLRLAMRHAEALCRARGARFTAMRRKVFEVLAEAAQPIGAYTVLDQLNAEGARVKPMTVYRALDFLAEHGLVHKLAGRNAFVACDHPHDDHAALFLICGDCGKVAELDSAALEGALATCAENSGFTPTAKVIEVEAMCRDCREAAE